MKSALKKILLFLGIVATVSCGGRLTVETCEDTIDPRFLGCFHAEDPVAHRLLISGNTCNELMGGFERDSHWDTPTYYLFGEVHEESRAVVSLYYWYGEHNEGCELRIGEDADQMTMQCPNWDLIRFSRVETGTEGCL